MAYDKKMSRFKGEIENERPNKMVSSIVITQLKDTHETDKRTKENETTDQVQSSVNGNKLSARTEASVSLWVK